MEKPPIPRWISGIEPPKDLLAASGAQILEMECRQQPECLNSLIDAYRNHDDIRSELAPLRSRAARSGPVLFMGMGASYCSAISGAILLQTHGRLSFAVDAGEWLHYGLAAWGEASASVLLTTSGESAEIVQLFTQGKGKPSGLICNNAASTCWGLADHKLPVLAGPEYGNATKTYTNATAASIILASEMLSLPWEENARRALEVLSGTLDRVFKQRAELEEFCRGAANIEIIGRGAGYGAAIMAALCIREMTGHRAAPHTGAGFRHGPNLDVDASHVAVILALGRTAALGVKLALECNRRGGKVVLISADRHERSDVLFPVQIDVVPEPWEGIAPLPVVQALTLAMVERTGCRLPPRFQYGPMEQ